MNSNLRKMSVADLITRAHQLDLDYLKSNAFTYRDIIDPLYSSRRARIVSDMEACQAELKRRKITDDMVTMMHKQLFPEVYAK